MSELKINFGCGGNRPGGWVNHDFEVDITKRLPYDDGTVDYILAEHVCEHLSCGHCLQFFDECRRILKPGGRLRVCVPTLYMLHGHTPNRDWCRDLIMGHGHTNLFTQETLSDMFWCAGFKEWFTTTRKECDGHWVAIGADKDHMETLRMEAVK